MRPNLTKALSVVEFQNYYWLKEELQRFCRAHNIPVSGSKIILASRITKFLESGGKSSELPLAIKSTTRSSSTTTKTTAQISPKQTKSNTITVPLSLSTIITPKHKCSQEVRAFFESQIPKFHFSTAIQNFFKNNVGKTYADAIEFWHVEQKRIKAPGYIKDEIPSQFEYNRFIRDFFADPKNKGKSRQDAITAWNVIKSQPGDNSYIPS